MSNEIKIEVGQVWQNNDDPDEKRTVIAEADYTYLLAGYTEDEYWPNIWLRDSYTLYRHADGTLAEPEQVDTGSDGGLSERDKWMFSQGGRSLFSRNEDNAWLAENAPPEPTHSKQVEELKAKIDNANMAASGTARDWESRCYSIMAALGEDYGAPSINHTSKQVEVLTARMNYLLGWLTAEELNTIPSDWFDSDGKAIIPDAEPEYCEWKYSKVPDQVWETSCGSYSSTIYDDWKFCPFCQVEIKEVSDD